MDFNKAFDKKDIFRRDENITRGNYVISLYVPFKYRKESTTQITLKASGSNNNAAMFSILNSSHESSRKLQKSYLIPLTNTSVDTAKYSDYYFVLNNKVSPQDYILEGFKRIDSHYFNFCSAVDKGKYKIVLAYIANFSSSLYFSNLKLDWASIKKEAGALSNQGNGFFYGAGYYSNGHRDTSNNYLVIKWDTKTKKKLGEKIAYGLSGDVCSTVEGVLKANTSIGGNKEYILLQLNNSSIGYTVKKGSFTSPVNLGAILSYLKTNTSLNTSSQDYLYATGSGNYSSSQINPITGIVQNSTAQIEYISDFPNYTLSFTPGLDKRSIVADPFGKAEEKVEIDSEQLILKTNIHKTVLENISNQLVLSDNPYVYPEINTSSIESSEFFSTLDSILNLNTAPNTPLWKDNKPPLLPTNEHDSFCLLPQTVCIIDKNKYQEFIDNEIEITMEEILKLPRYTLTDFMTSSTSRLSKKLLFFDVKFENGVYTYALSENHSFSIFLEVINPFITYVNKQAYQVDIAFTQNRKALNLYSLELFEAYTRGHDFIQEEYTTVRAKELDKDGNRLMKYDDNYFTFKYSGRDFDIMKKKTKDEAFTFSNGVCAALVHECNILTETDITLGDTYGQKNYFVEYIKYLDGTEYKYKDTFKVKDYLEAVDATKYIEEDLEIITSKIDLTQCQYYEPLAATAANKWCDCSWGGNSVNRECVYQKLGYCPYRFNTEKHPRKIRTLSQEKSNRFNLVQELSKVFEVYPQFYIEYDQNGKVLLDEQGRMKKHIFFITEKGNKNNLGFRYEKNLNNITRQIDSSAITTKMFVENVDSELSPTGVCSIQTAEDNLSKTSYLMDFSYYTKKGILKEEQVMRDLYGLEKGDLAFLPTIGYYNTKYDKLTNLIVNLTGETMVKLQAECDTYTQGVMTALEERQKIAQNMYQFKVRSVEQGNTEYTISDSYKTYLTKMKTQSTILWGNIETLFFTNSFCNLAKRENEKIILFAANLKDLNTIDSSSPYYTMIEKYQNIYCLGELFWRLMIEGFENEEFMPIFSNWAQLEEEIIDTNLYSTNGKLGQYVSMYEQVKKWKTERAKWLNKINDISAIFYKKYEPFIKEGTWTDSNYLTDNEYYWAATTVLNDSSSPKITYSIDVADLSAIDSDYEFDVADTSFVEDIDFFGINPRTGLPNKQKILVNSISEDLDNPMNNNIEVKNYETSFEDLFESISASVQSLTYNENTYKRAANFTATKYISKEALQGTLFNGDLTLVSNYSENLVMDDTGIQGKDIANTSLGYKVDGEGIAFTKDGGQTWDIGVGPKGINADYIKFGQLDAGKIQIVDGNYIYFLWDKNGINAYRNPATSTNGLVDFARFNKYGLSLIENNNVRLRAGYEFKSGEYTNPTGNYLEELELNKQNIGFYLYNDNGKPIFKTETASDYAGVEGDYSARLSLAGEMFVTNKVLDGDNDGSIISKVPEIKLTGGHVLEQAEAATLEEQENWKNIIDQASIDGLNYFFPEGKIEGNHIIIPKTDSLIIWTIRSITPQKSINYLYNSTDQGLSKLIDNKIQLSLLGYDSYSISIPETEDEYISIAANDNEIKVLIGENKPIYSSYSAFIEIKDNSLTNYLNEEGKIILKAVEGIYPNRTTKIAVSTYYDSNLSTTILESFDAEPVVCYNTLDLAIGSTIYPTNNSLYLYEYGSSGKIYSGWQSMAYTGEYITTNTSPVSTEEVGIFINNKMGVNEEKEASRNLISSLTEQETNSTESDNLNTDTMSQKMRTSGGSVDAMANNFMIIGDSITYGLSLNSDFGESNAFGVGSANFTNYNEKFKGKIPEGKTNLAFFMGMNTSPSASSTAKDYCDQYAAWINDILEGNGYKEKSISNIYIISVICPDMSKTGSNQTQEVIERVNSFLPTMEEYDFYGISPKFIDIFEASKNLDMADRCHPNPTEKGYKALCSMIVNAIAGELSSTITSSSDSVDPGADAAAKTALGSAQRVFTIALKGKKDDGTTTYNNVLTVLKNGYLYMGGTITDAFGNSLTLSNFNLLPDEVRIASPEFILSNTGYVWMDFNKIYPILSDDSLETTTSLMDMLTSLGSAVSGGASSIAGLPSGYYLIDPLAM